VINETNTMKKFIYYFLILTLSSCVTASHFIQIENREDQNEVEVYFTNRLLKEYEEIEIIETISTRLLNKKIDVLEKVKEIAKDKDGYAIIITDFDYISFVFSFHRIEAVLFKYKN